MLTLQAIVSGILLGGVYAALAIGLGLVWGVMKVLNIAHATLALLGAYLSLEIMQQTGLDPFASLVVTAPLLFAVGAFLQRFAVAPLEGRRDFETQTFLVLYGVMVVVENLTVFFWNTDVRQLSPGYSETTLVVAGLRLPEGRVIAFLAGLATLVLVYTFLRRSRLGLAVRALGYDREAAGLMGMPVRRIAMMAFGLATATAAVAGAGIGMVSAFFPSLGIVWVAKAFLVVVLGGVSNIAGLVIAAMGLGVLESVVGVVAPSYFADVAAYVLLIGVLMVRPQGLLGARV